MNNVHGVAVDLETRRVFVNDRDNHRIQIFDENGNTLRVEIAVSRRASTSCRSARTEPPCHLRPNTHKMLKYDLDGRLLYAWGTVAVSQARSGVCTA